MTPYFSDNRFYAEYDVDLSEVPLSILNIPALSSIIHFAWAIGCDVFMGEIDRTYLKGLGKIRLFLKGHPGFRCLKFKGSIRADRVIKNHFYDLSSKGLFFSGGCDSTAAYIAYKDRNPKLVFIWGLDIPTRWENYWKKACAKYAWMGLHKIKSNTEDIYDQGLRNKLGKGITEGYRPGYSFSFNTFGVSAPLTVVEGMNEIMLSSTYPSREYGDPEQPWTYNRPNHVIDTFMGWANIRTRDVLHEYSTNEKIRKFIKPYLERHGSLFLRSCGFRVYLERQNFIRLNCLECDKCERVIGMLVMNGVDPNLCGYPIDDSTFDRIRHNITTQRWNANYLKYHWSEIQRNIPSEVNEDHNGSKAFLEWLRGYEFWE